MLGWFRRPNIGASHALSLLFFGAMTAGACVAARFSLKRFRSALPAPPKKPKKPKNAADRDSHLVKANNILLMLSGVDNTGDLASEFYGIVVSDMAQIPSLANKIVYLCGDVATACDLELGAAQHVYVIKDLSHGYDGGKAWSPIDVGRVPIDIHGVGVYYRRFFDRDLDCFGSIIAEHAFQTLTESNKPGSAHRTGIYLTPVEQHGDETHFHLLRCSTNFSGPSVNFGVTDAQIVDALNKEAAVIFENQAPLNHVLAQIYHNTAATEDQKQTKAKIKPHSDKTKDMPANGIMAFCTFYESLSRLKPLEKKPFDYGRKNTSGLTKLGFRLKQCVAERPGCTLKANFSITLYPNSVFFMPLSTNRMYTHEILPGGLDIHMLPTRMGYVVRCSATEAVHKDDRTFLKLADGSLSELGPPTPESMAYLKELYAKENGTDEFINYNQNGPMLFSMNKGDYARPTLACKVIEFRSLAVPHETNPFVELFASVEWLNVGKGRLGNVLVKPDATRGVPIVRTTTSYSVAAQSFRSVHTRLAEQIQRRACLPANCTFNNALIEHYNNSYVTMGFHSDQEIDLDAGTYIAVFSCYKYPEIVRPLRKLMVESKEPGGTKFEIPLTHNSVIVWSLDTNRRFRHKIVLEQVKQVGGKSNENEWLGITFRTSKTFVQLWDGQARFEDGTGFTLATQDQRNDFFKMRRRENEETDFVYPHLPYTISLSDLLPPASAN